MNKEQKKERGAAYSLYMLLGALYVLVKIVFVLAGYLHSGAILHGLVPAVVTVFAGFLALIEFKKSNGLLWHKIMPILPVLIFVTTPIYMFVREKSEWLINGRLEVLVIYEVMAALQFFISLRRLKYLSK